MNNIKPQTSIYCTYKLKFHCGRGGGGGVRKPYLKKLLLVHI